MSPYPHPILAREGWIHIAIAVGASLVLTWLFGWWAAPAWLIAIFVVQFFRDPPRQIPSDPGIVLCAADGRVIKVEKTTDPYLKRDALLVSVFMNVFNVHSNRSPVDAEVVDQWYFAGAFFNADLDKASLENERNALHLRTASGADITCVQVAGLIARRILCYVKKGDAVQRGERYGFIRFGSRVDIYLPANSRVKVAIGDTVSAASTVLAELA